MQQIKSFGIFQTSKFVAILYFIIMAVIAIIAAPFILLAGMATGNQPGAELGLGLGFLVVLPFLYAIVAFLGTALTCWIYNMLAGRVGGIAVELEPTAPRLSTGTQF
ncbi:MAG: hypothetical protein ACR2L2_07715 [Acidobacteriota bacterium]